MAHKNLVAKIIFIIGVLEIIFGFIIGFVIGIEGSSYSPAFSWSNFFLYTIGGFIVGVLFIGFAELIERQTEANELLKENLIVNRKIASAHGVMNIGDEVKIHDNNDVSEENYEQKEQDDSKWIIDVNDQERIFTYFNKKNQRVQEIFESPIRDIVLVKADDEYILMQVGGFTPYVRKIDQFPSIKEWYGEIINH